jgi:hypothetical protein
MKRQKHRPHYQNITAGLDQQKDSAHQNQSYSQESLVRDAPMYLT